MVNLYGFDAYGTDRFNKTNGGIWMPGEGLVRPAARETGKVSLPAKKATKPEPKTWEKYHREHGTLDYYNRRQKPAPFGGIEADRIAQEKIAAQKSAKTPTIGTLPKPFYEIPPQKEIKIPDISEKFKSGPLDKPFYEIPGVQKPVNPEPVSVSGNAKPQIGSRRYPKVNLEGLTYPGADPVKPEPVKPDPVQPEGNKKVKPSRQERLKKIRNNPEARARYNNLKLRNNPELKARYESMKAFKKAGKWKKFGKWGAIAALAIGAGALLLNKCSGDKKAAPVVPPEPAQPAEPTQPVVPPEPAQPVEPTQPENVTVNAVKGDDYWKYAEMELIAEHQGEAGYKPTNSEIETRKQEIMARTNIGMAKDGIHSDPMLMVNDEVQLQEQVAKLRNEAIKQLKEEHKDQKDYEPTYSEVNKKYQELLAA